MRELTREAWIGHALETVLRDVRHAMRQLRRAPGFAAVVIATLALVIGATATVFSVMHAVLWRPLPYPCAERLLVMDADAPGAGGRRAARSRSSSSSAARTWPNLMWRVPGNARPRSRSAVRSGRAGAVSPVNSSPKSLFLTQDSVRRSASHWHSVALGC